MSDALTPTDLANKFSLAIDRNQGIRLSAEEVELLVIIGAFETISDASALYLRSLSDARLVEREVQKMSRGRPPTEEDVETARARVEAIFGRPFARRENSQGAPKGN